MQFRLAAAAAPTSDPPPRRSIPRGPPPSATSATGAPVASRGMAGERGGTGVRLNTTMPMPPITLAHPAATARCGRMASFFQQIADHNKHKG